MRLGWWLWWKRRPDAWPADATSDGRRMRSAAPLVDRDEDQDHRRLTNPSLWIAVWIAVAIGFLLGLIDGPGAAFL